MFMMNVSAWNDGRSGNVVANGFLIVGSVSAGSGNVVFDPTPLKVFPVNSLFVNTAPLWITEASTLYLYMLTTALYRSSAIYLARVSASSGSNFEFEYLSGFTDLGNNAPQWSPFLGAAVPMLNDNATVGVGELSVTWNNFLSLYLLSYFNFNSMGLGVWYLRTAADIWGPWSAPVSIFESYASLPWFENGWGFPYGGYSYTNAASWSATPASAKSVETKDNKEVAYFTLSLFIPYRAFLVSVNLTTLFPSST